MYCWTKEILNLGCSEHLLKPTFEGIISQLQSYWFLLQVVFLWDKDLAILNYIKL